MAARLYRGSSLDDVKGEKEYEHYVLKAVIILKFLEAGRYVTKHLFSVDLLQEPAMLLVD